MRIGRPTTVTTPVVSSWTTSAGALNVVSETTPADEPGVLSNTTFCGGPDVLSRATREIRVGERLEAGRGTAMSSRTGGQSDRASPQGAPVVEDLEAMRAKDHHR